MKNAIVTIIAQALNALKAKNAVVFAAIQAVLVGAYAVLVQGVGLDIIPDNSIVQVLTEYGALMLMALIGTRTVTDLPDNYDPSTLKEFLAKVLDSFKANRPGLFGGIQLVLVTIYSVLTFGGFDLPGELGSSSESSHYVSSDISWNPYWPFPTSEKDHYMIKDFQRDHGLDPDGIIGALTTEAMRSKWKLGKSQLAHFLGQSHVETGGFKYREENLNYSARRLREIFPKYFTPGMASRHAHDPEMIANITYSNRMGNGGFCSGEGWAYRGRGSLQLTGKYNYAKLGMDLNISNLSDYPDLVATELFWESGLSYFNVNSIWNLCAAVSPDFVYRVTLRVNGGTTALRERERWTRHYLKVQR